MALFTPDKVEFGDVVGLGLWLNGHWYEHQQFITIGLQATPRVQFVSYDILAWDAAEDAVEAWLDVHESMHESLRQRMGVGGTDLGEVKFDDPASFQNWMNYHALEHQQLRTAFGVT